MNENLCLMIEEIMIDCIYENDVCSLNDVMFMLNEVYDVNVVNLENDIENYFKNNYDRIYKIV